MSDSALATRFALRGYTVFEIDALRRKVRFKIEHDRYDPSRALTELSVKGRNHFAHVEEEVRTFMIAGLTAEDLRDRPASGAVVRRVGPGGRSEWLSIRDHGWRPDMSEDVIFSGLPDAELNALQMATAARNAPFDVELAFRQIAHRRLTDPMMRDGWLNDFLESEGISILPVHRTNGTMEVSP